MVRDLFQNLQSLGVPNPETVGTEITRSFNTAAWQLEGALGQLQSNPAMKSFEDFLKGVGKISAPAFQAASALTNPAQLVTSAGSFAQAMVTNQNGLRDRFFKDFQNNLQAAGNVAGSIASTIGDAASAAGGKLVDFLNDPEAQRKLLSSMGQALQQAWQIASDPKTYAKVWEQAKVLASDPDAALKVGKFVLEQIGFFDACEFVRHTYLGVAAIGRGDEAAAKQHFAGAAVHALGAADFARTVGLVALGGGLGVLAVAGAKSLGKKAAEKALESGAKALLKEGAEKIGKEVVGELAEKGLSKTIQEMAPKIADDGLRQLGEKIGKEGSQALTKEAMEQTMREAAETSTRELMEKMDVSGLVKDKTLKLLDELSGKSEKELREFFKNQGLKDPAKSAKELHAALRNGTADELLQKELVDGITKEIKEAIEKEMEAPFKARMRDVLRNTGRKFDEEPFSAVRKALDEQAEQLAKKSGRRVEECREELIEEYVEAGWKGAREGVEKAVREAVEKGVREAFEEFRKRVDDDNRPASRTRNRPNRAGPEQAGSGDSGNVHARGGSSEAGDSTDVGEFYAFKGQDQKLFAKGSTSVRIEPPSSKVGDSASQPSPQSPTGSEQTDVELPTPETT